MFGPFLRNGTSFTVSKVFMVGGINLHFTDEQAETERL